MRRYLFLAITLCFFYVKSPAQESHLAVQSVHAEGATNAVLDNNNELLVTYGYKDQTLKFWNKKTGFLYKTVDLPGYSGGLQVNEKAGKTYILISNTIYVYDNTTFEVLKTYPLGQIYSISFNPTASEEGMLLLYAQDTNGNKAMYSLDENTGEFVNVPISEFPGKGEPNDFYFNTQNTFAFIETNYLEYFLYDAASGQYYDLSYDYEDPYAGNGKPIKMFDNGDILFLKYTKDGKTRFTRNDVRQGKELWAYEEKTENFKESNAWAGYQVVLEKDNQSFWIAMGESTFLELNAPSGYILGKIYREDFKNAMVSDGDYLYAQSGLTLPYAKFKRYQREPVLEFGHGVFEPMETTAFFNDGEVEFITGDFDGDTYSLLSNAETSKLFHYGKNYRFDGAQGLMVADKNSKAVYSVPRNTEKIKRFLRGQPGSFEDVFDNTENVDNMDFDPVRKVLATMGGSALRVIDINNKKLLYLKMIPSSTPLGNDGISLSPRGKQVAFITYDKSGTEFYDKRIEYVDYENQQLLWKKLGKYNSVKHIKNGSQLLAVNMDGNVIEILDSSTGNLIKSYKLHTTGYDTSVQISPDEKYLFVTGAQLTPAVYSLDTGQKIKDIPISNMDYFEATFVTSNFILKGSRGSLRLYDVLTGKEVLRVYIFLDGEWLAHTPDGYFDGSQGAWSRVAFSKGNTFIPLSTVFNKFYSPRLIYNTIFKKPLERDDLDIDDLNPAPVVNLDYKEGSRNLVVEDDINTLTTSIGTGTVNLNIESFGDKIIEAQLFHNGKRITNRTRNLVVEDDVTDSQVENSYTVSLLEGENTFTATAINSQNTESIPVELKVTYVPKKEEQAKPRGIQMHVLTVGINAYKNPKYNLNYAVADAKGFTESLKQGVQPITSTVQIQEITDEKAVRQSILDKFKRIQAEARPQDIFVFYYAGHGVLAQDAQGESEFYLVPYDVTQVYGDDAGIRQKGISAAELKQIASQIQAQKQLYILDACQSGGALKTIANRGAAEEKAIAQLARSTGTHWLTASGSEQFATEFDELGHGVFTYTILQALSGKADSGDGRITVNELKAYLESQVPEVSQKYKGSPQYPSSFGFGQDFPIGITQK